MYVNGSLVVAVIVPAQLSVAVGALTLAEHCPVTVGNIAVTGTGFSLSVTITICVAVAVRPLLSVTVQVTVVVPTGYNPSAANDAPSLVTLATPQLSAVTALPRVTAAPHTPGSLFTVIAAGAVMVGGILSVTVTSKLFTTVPQPLLAVTATCVIPVLKVNPLPVPVPLPVVVPVNT